MQKIRRITDLADFLFAVKEKARWLVCYFRISLALLYTALLSRSPIRSTFALSAPVYSLT